MYEEKEWDSSGLRNRALSFCIAQRNLLIIIWKEAMTSGMMEDHNKNEASYDSKVARGYSHNNCNTQRFGSVLVLSSTAIMHIANEMIQDINVQNQDSHSCMFTK